MNSKQLLEFGWCVVDDEGDPDAGLFTSQEEADEFASEHGYPSGSVKYAKAEYGSEMQLC